MFCCCWFFKKILLRLNKLLLTTMRQKANNIEIALMIRRDHIDKKKNVR